MTANQLIGFAINASMFLIVFAVGLQTTMKEATYLLERPGLLVRSLVSMNIIMVIVALGLIAIFNPAPEIKIALVALALSPVPPILPTTQERAGGSHGYTMGLLLSASIAAVVLVPAGLWLLDVLFSQQMQVSPANVAGIVVISIIVPAVLGILVNTLMPALAARLARPISLLAMLVLVVAVIPVIFATWPLLGSFIGNGLFVGLIGFTLIGLLVGHFLGGPDPDERTVLALATSTRHPGVAITIASLNFPDFKGVLVVVLYHLLFGAITNIPYVKWRTRQHAAAHKGAVR
ncbi:MAG TPA: Na+-dependent transporter [Devosiaceae bacterium]|jgi:BASS family bile acid:Na+ symporter